MSYNDLLKGLALNNLSDDILVQPSLTTVQKPIETNVPLFTVENFKQNLKDKSAISNKRFIDTSERLNAYDIVVRL